jgi:hypothetical protein
MTKDELIAEIEHRIERQQPNIGVGDRAAFWICKELEEILEMVQDLEEN